MLYSIGKDSSVMLHLALKAFYPSKPPFPLLHIDTTWKFREMIEFRQQTITKLGLELIAHVNEEGLAENINPFSYASSIYSDPATMNTFLSKQKIARFIASGSSLKLCLVADGSVHLYPRLGRTMEWDTAAGHTKANRAPQT